MISRSIEEYAQDLGVRMENLIQDFPFRNSTKNREILIKECHDRFTEVFTEDNIRYNVPEIITRTSQIKDYLLAHLSTEGFKDHQSYRFFISSYRQFIESCKNILGQRLYSQYSTSSNGPREIY